MQKITTTKIIFNFTDECTMECPYCYIPFKKDKVSKLNSLRVMEKLCEFEPSKITIGGGDPLSYNFLPELVKVAYNQTKNVHIDTNGYGHIKNPNNLKKIIPYLSLLGLPLDGHNSTAHGNMRQDNKHFKIVIDLIEETKKYNLNLKVNTVLSSKNYKEIDKLAKLLLEYDIKQWSIFQFWPLARGFEKQKDYYIDTNLYKSITSNLIINFPHLPIKAASIENRKSNYLFVTHNGNTYTISPSNPYKYKFLGSIFQNDIIDLWNQYSHSSS